MLPLLLNAFLVLFGADAILSCADDLMALGGLPRPLEGVRGVAAGVAMAGCLLVSVGLVVTPRVPWRPLVLPALFPWVATVLSPIPTLLTFGLEPGGSILVSLPQLVVAIDAILAVRRRTGGWWLRPEGVPALSWWHSVKAIGWLGLCTPALVATLFVAELQVALDVSSGGYIRLTGRGIELTEHQLYRGGQYVRLVAMQHVGDRQFYEKLLDELAQFDALVLDEGVDDPDQRLGATVPHVAIAEALGLDSQDAFHARNPGVRRRNADVTTREFSEPTVALLRAATGILDGVGDPAVELLAYVDLATPETMEQAKVDIVDRRNAHLVAEIERAAAEGESVVVPWGALHLGAVEAELQARGWERGGWRTRVVVAW
ncbi:MAG: hypothetical protein FJ102_15100 [Deltaproteobacteria bacterium]|nr:hypothetical protein [Deltaproteobacteria bacterium]